MSVNKVILIGRLGQDPELKYTPSGQAVCNFTLATSENWSDKNGQKQERTEWHRIVVWGKLGELCNQYLQKGRQAFVEGRLQTRSWDGKDGQKRYTTETVAMTVQFLGAPQARSEDRPAAAAKTETPAAPAAAEGEGPIAQDYNVSTDINFTADDIPF